MNRRRRVPAQGLTEAGYVVDWVEDGITGQHQAETEEYDLLVLDVMLPGQDGWTLLQNLRRSKSTPVLFLTARDDVGDRVKGLGSAPTTISRSRSTSSS